MMCPVPLRFQVSEFPALSTEGEVFTARRYTYLGPVPVHILILDEGCFFWRDGKPSIYTSTHRKLVEHFNLGETAVVQ
jgi:hypothetical protein